MAIENTAQYNGLYHILGGVISPIDGIGIADLNISQLIDRVRTEQTEEVILALPTTMEGDTTNIYINRQLKQFPGLKVSTIARGIAIGDNLEYADEITLGRSIVNRIPFEYRPAVTLPPPWSADILPAKKTGAQASLPAKKMERRHPACKKKLERRHPACKKNWSAGILPASKN